MLDKKRHFIEIFGGAADDGAHFIQDGIRYGAEGLEVNLPTEEAAKVEVAKAKGRGKAKVEELLM